MIYCAYSDQTVGKFYAMSAPKSAAHAIAAQIEGLQAPIPRAKTLWTTAPALGRPLRKGFPAVPRHSDC